MSGGVAGPGLVRERFARAPVVSAMLALAVVLAVLAPHYGYHRDELYFRMLPADWGYTDQPFLTPLLARTAITLFGDSVMALRVVALLCAVASLPVLALITREVGGGRRAQALAAWGMAGATLTLQFGHVLLTASLDLVIWPAVLLLAIRAVLREDGRWWLAAGAVIGVSSANKLLVVVLMIGIAAGLALCGPRSWFASGRLWLGVAIAGLLAAPSVLYQGLHGWPQLAMGEALRASNADEVRVMMWPMLVLLVGPVLAVFWVVAILGMFRRPEWRPLRFLVVVFVVVVLFVLVGGTQFYYTAGMLGALVAIGAVPVAQWARSPGRRRAVAMLLVVNAAGCAVAALPVLPVRAFGASGLAAVNSAAADQVGWPQYAEQIRTAATDAGADVIITSNYGEAGALHRFGAGAIPVVSGHVELWHLDRPPAHAQTVVIVGGQTESAQHWFDSCRSVAELNNGLAASGPSARVTASRMMSTLVASLMVGGTPRR